MALKMAHFVLELLNPLLRLLHHHFLHQCRLHEHVGRIGVLTQGIPDQRLRIPVLLDRALLAHAIEQSGDHLAFIRGHEFLPQGFTDEHYVGAAINLATLFRDTHDNCGRNIVLFEAFKKVVSAIV